RHRAGLFIHLQRTIGNQAVQRLLRTVSARPEGESDRIPLRSRAPLSIQTQLTVNEPGDEYEQEADRVSEAVMRMPGARVQRRSSCGGSCPRCREDETGDAHEPLQMMRAGGGGQAAAAAPPIVDDVLRLPGQPVDAATREFMEPRFGRDFSLVRVHSGDLAEQ